MTVIKNQKSNTYEVRTYYKDWTGVRKQKTKRGFKRKCDAQEWERAFKLKENLSLDMYFEDFVDLYLNDIKSRIVASNYTGSKDDADAICVNCGYKWTTRADHLADRCWCPKCKRKIAHSQR